MDVSISPPGYTDPVTLPTRQLTPGHDLDKSRHAAKQFDPGRRVSSSDRGPGEVQRAIDAANTLADFLDQRIAFRYDERVHLVVVKVIRDSTEEVLYQIPPQALVELMVKMRESFTGLLVDQKG